MSECYTTLEMYCTDRYAAEQIANTIKGWAHNIPGAKNDFGDGWLGNILINAGICTYEQLENAHEYNKPTTPKCRGKLVEPVMSDGNVVQIYTETIHEPMLQMWVKIVEKWFPEVEKMLYVAEIDDEGLLFTNDPELAGLWFMEFHDTYKDIEASFTADELIKLMQEKTGSTSEDMYELMEEMKEIDEDFLCHQFEFVSIEDCE